MNVKQKWIVGGTVGIFCLLIVLAQFRLPQKAPNVGKVEQPQKFNIEEIIPSLDKKDKDYLDSLNVLVNKSTESGQKVDYWKDLSGYFYKNKKYLVAGYFAEKVAEVENSKNAWFIAGSSYLGEVENAEIAGDISKQRDKAIFCLDKAASLDSEDINIKIQKAIVYTQFPLADEPMKGILALRELNKAYPKNTEVLKQLVRLAIKTNQIDKAIGRLKEWQQIEPDNHEVDCLLVDCYKLMGDVEGQKKHLKNCK
jgi:tetratricopeptide (TPR) repeat protein